VSTAKAKPKASSAVEQQEQVPHEKEHVIKQAGLAGSSRASSGTDEDTVAAAASTNGSSAVTEVQHSAPKAAAEAVDPSRGTFAAGDEDATAVITAAVASTPARRSRAADRPSIGLMATPVTGGPTTRSRARAAAAMSLE
jgi:hypothetical protein